MGIGGIIGAVGSFAKNALDTTAKSDKKDDTGKKENSLIGSIKKIFKKSDGGEDITDFGGPGYKKGGVVKKTGKALVHKGERVLTKRQAKKYIAKKGPRKRV